MKYFDKTNIDFMGKKPLYIAFSAIMIAVSIGALIYRQGPVLGIDFTGGSFLQIGFKELPPLDGIRDTLNKDNWENFTLQSQPSNHSVIIRVKSGEKSKEDIAEGLVKSLKTAYGDQVNNIPDRIEFVGPVVGHNLIKDTFMAIAGSLMVIVFYVAIRFKKWVWGFAGVLALMHDVFITIGFLTLLNVEFTLVVIAALLTLAGYSINDTIIIFDRMRENIRTARRESLTDIFNRSLNETLTRTINTGMTTLLAALSLQIIGGEVIHDFALTLVFGVIIGTYSSIGVATTLVQYIQEKKK